MLRNHYFKPAFADTTSLITDPGVEKAVRENIHKPVGPITEEDLLKVTRLDDFPANSGILQYCKNLETLSAFNIGSIKKPVLDLSPLSNLHKLKELNIASFEIIDLSPLSTLDNLETLKLRFCTIPNFTKPLKLYKLKKIDLSDTGIQWINGLKDSSSLEEINLDRDQIYDLSPIENCINLNFLSASNNRIKNLEPIAKMENLKTVMADNNDIADASPLLEAFESHLDVDENTSLKDFPKISLKNNPLDTQSLTVILPQLEQKGILVTPSCWNWLKPLVEENSDTKYESKTLDKFLAFWVDNDNFPAVQKDIIEILSDPNKGYTSGLILSKKINQSLEEKQATPIVNQRFKKQQVIQDVSVDLENGNKLSMLEEWNGRDDTGWSTKESCLFIYLNNKVEVIPNKSIVQTKPLGKFKYLIDITKTYSSEFYNDVRERWLLDLKNLDLKKIATIDLRIWASHAGTTYNVEKLEDFSDSNHLGNIITYARGRVYRMINVGKEDEDSFPVDSPYYLRRVYAYDLKNNSYVQLREDKVPKIQDDSKTVEPLKIWEPSKEDELNYNFNR